MLRAGISKRVFFITAAITAALLLVFAFVPTPVFAEDDPGLIQGAVNDAVSNAINESPVGSCFADFGKCFFDAYVYILTSFLHIGMFFVGVAGIFLDVSFAFSLNMGALLEPGSPIGSVVATAWSVFRDLANLMFIAGLIWASIAMILQTNVAGGNASKLVANIIIAAVLVNFSYFFTGVIIDSSNILSRLIYEQGVLSGQESVQIKDVPLISVISGVMRGGVSGIGVDEQIEAFASSPHVSWVGRQFIDKTKISSIIDPDALRELGGDGGVSFLILISASSMLLIGTAELFMSMTFTLIARLIALFLLLITSPLLVFKLLNIQPFAGWGDHWWKSLMSQVIFLPVFVFLLAISFQMIAGFVTAFQLSKVSYSDLLFKPSQAEFIHALALLFLFVIAYGLLKASQSISQNIASGAPPKLPSVDMLQGPATKWGGMAGKGAAWLMRAPRSATFWGAGKTVEGVGAGFSGTADLAYRNLGLKSVVGGVKSTARDVKARVPFTGESPADIAREKRMKDRARDAHKQAMQDVTYFEAQAEEARARGDVEGERAARAGLQEAQGKLTDAYNNMYDTLGVEETAKHIGALEQDEQDRALEALGPDKAKEITDAMRSGKAKPEKKHREHAEEATGASDRAVDRLAAAAQSGDDRQLTAALEGIRDEIRREGQLQLSAEKRNAFMDFLQEKKNALLIADALDENSFSDIVAGASTERITPQFAESVAPHLNTSALAQTLAKPISAETRAAVEQYAKPEALKELKSSPRKIVS